MLSPRERPDIGDCCMLTAVGVIGLGEEVAEAVEGGVASEFRERAFPLLYIPCGTVRVRNRGSWSTVGMLGRSEYVKYAVKCHFRGFAFTESTTHAE